MPAEKPSIADMPVSLTLPLSASDVTKLKLGDTVLISGELLTGRDRVHKWLFERFINRSVPPSEEDVRVL